ncbi:hypothetical protein DB30_03110 [Enhygromyxa salina]|uniref:Uncharacterized protein n=1 Tax=Enhygromyxa salina TaxID=215803 RepID=A0A0C2CUP3_9BACT|nr:hypothetical protein DB30_03110 [Enhygromyxa salina]
MLAAACGPAKPDVEVDGWALARAAMLDGESCYADQPAYCIADPAFVDAAIQAALDGRFSGTMPKLGREVDKLIRSARVHYRDASRTPESLTRIEALVQAHYDAPSVDASSDPKLVNVDLGALPGRLALRGRTDTIALAESPLIESFWWQGAEAGRTLAKYAIAHPDKAVVRIQLQIPKGSSSDKTLVYRYFRAQNRVAFGELLDDSVYLTGEISGGLEAMAAGRLSLGKEARKLCSRPRSIDDGPREWCPWQDEYGEAAKRARK